MKTFRTFCSGGELFGVGAQAAGWQHVDGFEIEGRIAAIAQLNGFQVHTTDVCAVDWTALPEVDHFHGSPSCKTASQANVNAGESPDDLAVADAFCRGIAAHTGRTVSLENVWQYRNYESFQRILRALQAAGFVYDYDHINAADFGVPQTRRRLILRAVRGARVPTFHPTHREGGDMFHPPWVGWYVAIADLIPTLPDTKPAPWQMARMPKELRESMLMNGTSDMGLRHTNEPAATVVATVIGKAAPPRAYIMSNAATEYGDGVREDDEPMFSVTSQHGGRTRALLVSAGSDGHRDIVPVREGDEPAMTTTTNADGRMRALLIRNDNTGQEWGKGYRGGNEPSMTIRTDGTPRAFVGRWVKMTVQALGRFQTVPDTYKGLTSEVNGNGVPCLLAQRIMETLL